MTSSRDYGRPIEQDGHVQPSGYGCYTVPILWILHGWMAMFFLAAAYAKLSEPIALLSILMDWPGATTPQVVRAVGWIELGLALLQLAPFLSAAPAARAVALASTAVLAANAVAMTALYIVRPDPGLVATNIALIVLSAGIFLAYRTSRARRGRG
ncbi:MAG: DoxX family protein [Pseudomonadota bacterium]|nr:DoxX family protein [Pseudomonadota bacterium]